MTNAKEFVGKNGNTKLPQRYWDGVWVSANGRLPRNIAIGGGVDIGRQVDDHCFTVDVPNQPLDVNGTGGVTTWNGFNSSGRRHVPRRDVLDEQPGLPPQRQRPDQGRIQRQLHLPQHAGRDRECDA